MKLLPALLLATICSLSHASGPSRPKKKVAVVGAGVIGISSALAFYTENTGAEVTVFYDRPFRNITSYGPAGLFQLENGSYRTWGKNSYRRYSQLFRDVGGESGVHKVSGYMTSTNRSLLEIQERNFGDYVYDFRYLKPWEMQQFNNRTDLHAIHFTSFTTQGRRYVPWMIQQLKGYGVRFVKRHIQSVNDLLSDYDVVVNAAGLNGGRVAGDVGANDVFPIRGILLEIDAPWQKHFLWENLETYAIPVIDSVKLGTVKHDNNTNTVITEEDRQSILQRYYRLQPAMKDVKIKSEWLGFRPGRYEVRHELVKRGGKRVIHNYGHGGNGFTLSWGCALDVVRKAYQ